MRKILKVFLLLLGIGSIYFQLYYLFSYTLLRSKDAGWYVFTFAPHLITILICIWFILHLIKVFKSIQIHLFFRIFFIYIAFSSLFFQVTNFIFAALSASKYDENVYGMVDTIFHLFTLGILLFFIVYQIKSIKERL